MRLASPYSLPYAVTYSDGQLMSIGRDVRVEVTLGAAATSAAIDELDALVLPFQLLASAGALAGNGIKPWNSTILDKDGPFVGGDVVGWTLRSCAVDERGIVMLAQMLLSAHSAHSIAKVAFTSTVGYLHVARVTLGVPAADPFPALARDLGFPLRREGEVGREVLVQARFDAALTDKTRAAVDAELYSWASGLLSGAYGIAPLVPDVCTATVEPVVTYGRQQLTWGFARFSAHPAALDGLTNVFASISERVARVAELTIE